MLDDVSPLPEDPEELRAFIARLLAEVRAQAVLIEKLRHQLASHARHRFGASSETAEQLQLALETSEIAAAAMTARLRLPDIEANREKDRPKRRPIPDHVPRMEVELGPGADACADCGGRLRRIGEGEPSRRHAFETDGEHRGTGIRPRPLRREPDRPPAAGLHRLRALRPARTLTAAQTLRTVHRAPAFPVFGPRSDGHRVTPTA